MSNEAISVLDRAQMEIEAAAKRSGPVVEAAAFAGVLDPEERALSGMSSTPTEEAKLRSVDLATFVILRDTGNSFFTKTQRSERNAFFDAAAFAWLHTAPQDEVDFINWRNPREYTMAVTRFLKGASPKQLVKFIQAAKAAAIHVATELESSPKE